MSCDEKKNIFNLANIVTTFRLIVSPIFIFLLVYVYNFDNYSPWLVWTIAILYMLAAASDKLDGYWARKYDLVTVYGKIVDPIADKCLVLGGFIALSYIGVLPWYFTIIVTLRDLIITILRILLLKNVVISASNLAKWKTTFQMFLIFLFVFPFSYIFVFDTFAIFVYKCIFATVYWVAFALTIITFVDYLYAMWLALKTNKK